MTSEEIKTKRIEAALSQEELAKLAGVTRATINRIETRTDIDQDNIKYRKSIKKIEVALHPTLSPKPEEQE